MTIFLEIAKKFLIPVLKQLRTASKDADKSLTNSLLTLIGVGRDLEVSKEKRKLIKALIEAIEKFVPAPVSATSETESTSLDHTILASLTEMIRETKKQGATIANKANLPTEGYFGPCMTDLISALECIFDALSEHRLINIPNIPQPLPIFLFYAGCYLASKANNTRIRGALESIQKNPRISSSMELETKKEQLLMDSVRKCFEDLKDTDPFSVEKRLVGFTVDRLLLANMKLCAEYGSTIEIPLRVSVFALASFQLPTFRPGLGDLDDCMNQAKIEIDQLTEYHPESEPSASMAASSSSMAPHM